MAGVSERDVLAAFRLRGLSVSVDGMKALMRHVREGQGREKQLRMVAEVVEQLCAAPDGSVVGAERVEAAVGALEAPGRAEVERQRVVVVSAFEAPRLRYDGVRRGYVAEAAPPRSLLHAPAEAKLAYVRDRFQLVRQRVLRDPHFFVANSAVQQQPGDRVGLTNIEALIGSNGTHCVLGILSQTPDDGWAIEDLGGRIMIDITNAVRCLSCTCFSLSPCWSSDKPSLMQTHTEGMITEGSVVLATGEIVDGVMRVDTVGLPPAERRGDGERAIGGGVDYFGGAPTPALQAQLERDAAASESLVVVLSEVWLDEAGVLQRLHTMLGGFEAKGLVPELFVVMGNFTLRPFGGGHDHMAIPGLFDGLGGVIQGHPEISRRSRFLLVAGPSDPCGTTVSALPRGALPRSLIGQLGTRLGERVMLGSNPSRVRVWTEEMVVFREDIITKMHRYCVVGCKADTAQELSRQFVRSICDQGHLCPLALSVCPVHWCFGHSLMLEPLPHVVVVGDRVEAFVHTYSGCVVVNPGPFSRDGTFVAFQPSTCTAEIGNVNNPIDGSAT